MVSKPRPRFERRVATGAGRRSAAVVPLAKRIFALAATVGTFAIRESLARRNLRSGAIDLATEGGRSRLRTAFLGAWALCDGIGALGLGLALASGDARVVTPYVLGAAVLFVLHRPTAWLLDSATS